MILSNVRIRDALDDGSLVIQPRPELPYDTTSVDLSLGDEISWLKEGLPISIDFRQGKFKSLFTKDNCVRRTITNEEGFNLQPHKFVLAKTREYVALPLREGKPCLAARVEGKSSYARCGLLVHFTAPTVHNNFDGTITLEMMNLGQYPISLYPGIPICQLILERVDGVPVPKDSQFKGQSTPTGEKD
jgi:dCTP deaminase